MIVEINDQLG